MREKITDLANQNIATNAMGVRSARQSSKAHGFCLYLGLNIGLLPICTGIYTMLIWSVY